jgi:ParB/RepB/Spo0J family partition protein
MSAMNAPEVPNGFELRFVDPATVHDNPDNVRGPKRDRTGLAASITALGILNPPLVRQDADGELWLIAGERRKHSAIAAGVASIPVYVRSDLTAAQRMAGVLVENQSREGLSEVALGGIASGTSFRNLKRVLFTGKIAAFDVSPTLPRAR